MATLEKRVQILEKEYAARNAEELLTIAVRILASKEAFEKLQETVEELQKAVEKSQEQYDKIVEQQIETRQRFTGMETVLTQILDRLPEKP
jgi:chromosome segregation ATPase